jgi:hypothetical protein
VLYHVDVAREAYMTGTLLTRPSALAPIAMSAAAVAVIVGYIVMFGTARQADEGTAAHLWQLLMAGQVPVIAFFAIRWLPAEPRKALPVLALQFAAALIAVFPVCYFNW